jgi:hypothetical protein
MKRVIMLFLISILLIRVEIFPSTDFVQYSNKRFNYSFIYPGTWEINEIDLVYRHLLLISLDKYTVIKVTASGADDDEKEKWNSIKEWYSKGTGSRMRLILEKKNFNLNRSTVSRLLVFQYRIGKRKMLTRMTITDTGSSIIVMECSAPIITFYEYDRIFNAVLRSIKINP